MEKSRATFRFAKPHAEALYCWTCRCWKVPFTTKVLQPGWALCSMCHTCEWTDSFDEIPWGYRTIRMLGFKGESKFDHLHSLVKSDSGEKKIVH